MHYYLSYTDSKSLIKALAMNSSLEHEGAIDYQLFLVCLDEYTRVLLTKLNLNNVHLVAIHDLEQRDEELLSIKNKLEYKNNIQSFLPFWFTKIIEQHPYIDKLMFVSPDIYFYSSINHVFNRWNDEQALFIENSYSSDLMGLEKHHGRFHCHLFGVKNCVDSKSILSIWKKRVIENNNQSTFDAIVEEWAGRYQSVIIFNEEGMAVSPRNHSNYYFDANNDGQVSVNNQFLVFYHFNDLEICNDSIFKPFSDTYQVSINLILKVYLPYLNQLHAEQIRLKNILGDDIGSLTTKLDNDELLDKRLLISQSSNVVDSRLSETHQEIVMQKGWSCFSRNALLGENEQNIEHSSNKHHFENNTVLVWPEGKSVVSPDDILHALRGRTINRKIETLYVIGAYQFEEKDLLFSLFPQLQKVYLFEPTPEAYNYLMQACASDERVEVFPYAISDQDGESQFNISNNWQSSSLLNMGKHKEIFPGVEMTHSVRVLTKTIPSVIHQHALIPPDMLFIDAQGAENRILSALDNATVERLKLIYTEASTEELYIGSGTLTDLRQLLSENFTYMGFAPTRNETPTHGNTLFVHNDYIAELQEGNSQEENNESGIDSLIGQGEELVKQGDYDSAKTVFEKGLVQDPDNIVLHNNMGVVCYELGDQQDAVKHLYQAIQIDPYFKNAIINCTTILSKLNEHELANEVCQNYLEVNANDLEILKLQANNAECIFEKWLARSECIDTNYEAKPYKVTAIVSTYNSEAFIEECLSDLVAQTMINDIEIIVLDAASEQNERAVVAAFQSRWNNIRYIRTPERIGIYLAWNIMAYMASSPCITPFSTNDRLRLNAYELLHKQVSFSQAALVYGDSYITTTPHQDFENHTTEGLFQWPAYTRDVLLQNCMVGPHPMWRKSIHQEIGYFDDTYDAIGDQEFWCRIALHYDILHIDEFTGLYWATEESLSGNQQTSAQEIDRYRQKYASFIAA